MHVAPTLSASPHAPILDDTDWRILAELEQDARIPWAQLGRRVSLTAPAVRERVRRLERDGVLVGYRALVDTGRLGRAIDAFVRVATPSQSRQDKVAAFAEERAEIVECHSLTGEDCFLLRVRVATMPELEQLTSSLATMGRTTTSLVLGSPVPHRPVARR